MIELQNIEKRFRKKTVLHDVSGRVEEGSCVGLVGLNGAGKTTLIRTILGLYKPSRGKVLLMGKNPRKSPETIFKTLGIVRESDGFNGHLTFIENLQFYGRIKGLSKDEVAAYAQKEWPDLLRKEPVLNFSRGQRMQCSLARAFLGSPKLFIFDEPTTALDHEGYAHFCDLVRRHNKEGASFLLSSHRLETIEQLCDSVVFLKEGKAETVDFTEKVDQYTIECSDSDKAKKLLLPTFPQVHAHSGSVTFAACSKEEVAQAVESLVGAKIDVYEVMSLSHLQQFMRSELI